MIGVAEAFVHPGYNPETMQGDIAILRLATPSTHTPLSIVPPSLVKSLLPGMNVTIAGWGLQGEANAAAKMITTTTAVDKVRT
jgi:secreted trypsin-like serine protease